MLAVDFKNAFNLVDPSAILQGVRVRFSSIFLWIEILYGHTTRSYLENGHIISATRVQQGDTLRRLLFSLMIHPLNH